MTFSKNQKFEKLGLFIEKSVQKHPRNSDAEIIENIRNSMPKWSQNPSKIHQKSILKSRSEKERPKIDKNRGLERPRVENVAASVSRASRFWPGWSLQTNKKIEDCIHVIPHASGPLARRILTLSSTIEHYRAVFSTVWH